MRLTALFSGVDEVALGITYTHTSTSSRRASAVEHGLNSGYRSSAAENKKKRHNYKLNVPLNESSKELMLLRK